MGRGCVRNTATHRCLPRGNHGSCSWRMGLRAEPASPPLFAPWRPPRPHCLPCSEAASLQRIYLKIIRTLYKKSVRFDGRLRSFTGN
ncbi:MAG: hypothetical protein F6J90_31400 [Moorea sp. SIOASIH]|nr:hypothetical protein [Moorena sp. SIOASIH]